MTRRASIGNPVARPVSAGSPVTRSVSTGGPVSPVTRPVPADPQSARTAARSRRDLRGLPSTRPAAATTTRLPVVARAPHPGLPTQRLASTQSNPALTRPARPAPRPAQPDLVDEDTDRQDNSAEEEKPGRHRLPSISRKRLRLVDYPRRGKRGIRRWLPSWKLILGTFLFFAAGLVTAFYVALALVQLPQPNGFAIAQATIIDYADGSTQIAHVGTNRVSVPFDQIPPVMREAIVAAEDRSFYSESGVSPRGMVRALRNDLFGSDTGDLQGGSTITQQYVKNYYLTEQQTFSRKITEILISIKLDEQQSKDQILQNYLNTVFFARDSYGVETASMAYFGEPVSALANDPAKAAYLAAVTNSPYYFGQADDDPAAATALKARWNYVLDGMVATHDLTQQQRATLVFPTPIKRQSNDLAGNNGYMVNAAIQYLDTEHATDPNAPSAAALDRGGYTIVTTFTKASMAAAQTAATTDLASLRPSTNAADVNVHLGVCAVDSQTGAVTGFYGGPDYTTQGYNDALQATGPIGNTIGSPIEHSLSLNPKGYWQTEVTDLTQLGITDQQPNDNPPGDDDLQSSAVQVAAAYALAVNAGMYHAPYEVTEVLHGGQVVWQAQPPSTQYYGVVSVRPGMVSGSDGADQWAWTVGYANREVIAVDMYATKPTSQATRSLTGMTPLPGTIPTSTDTPTSTTTGTAAQSTATQPKSVAVTRTANIWALYMKTAILAQPAN